MNAAQVSKRRALAWAAFPAVLLVGLIGTQFALLSRALGDPSFSVEEHYYDKAVAWDAHRAQERRNADLGWRVDVDAEITPLGKTRIVATCVDRAGAPVRGARMELEGFHNARAGQVYRAALFETPSGYVTELPAARSGLWEFRLEVDRGPEHFTEVVRRDVSRGESGR